MQQIDLKEAYKRAVDQFVQEITVRDALFDRAFDYDNQQDMNVDNGRSAIFARCYEATMSYLLITQDIKTKHKEGSLSHADRTELLSEAQRIKEAGSIMFNGMVNSGIYLGQPNMKPFLDFWGAFYNGEEFNARDTAKTILAALDEAHDVLAAKEKVKMGSEELGRACLQFSSSNELAKMMRLALQVDNSNIYKFREHLTGIEERIDAIKTQCAAESKLTEKGFVTHCAFALPILKRNRDNVELRDNRAQSAERYVLSSPGIPNKTSQEINHAGFGKVNICSITSQRTHGIKASREYFMDTIRAFYSCCKSGTKMMNDAATLLRFCMSADPQTKESAEKVIKEFEKKLNEKMPQTTIGRHTASTPTEASLYVMLLDAKAEQYNLTPLEEYERSAMRDVFEAIVSTTKDCLETLAKGKTYEFDMTKELGTYEISLFDRWRYDNLPGMPECYGLGSSATMRLVTHLMSNGDQEFQKDPELYNQTIDFLVKTFGEDLEISDHSIDHEH